MGKKKPRNKLGLTGRTTHHRGPPRATLMHLFPLHPHHLRNGGATDINIQHSHLGEGGGGLLPDAHEDNCGCSFPKQGLRTITSSIIYSPQKAVRLFLNGNDKVSAAVNPITVDQHELINHHHIAHSNPLPSILHRLH